MTDARFLVGIDLGTTNSALAFVDREGPQASRRQARILPIPQLLAPGEIGVLDVLPSFLYRPGDEERQALANDDLEWVVGAYARERGASTPTRQVASAKSWLSHPSVDRSARLLPWGNDEGLLSPVDASARLLVALRDAWNRAKADGHEEWRLEQLPVVLGVPASFDQEARELTLEAARAAGLAHLTLLEEPLAAFYAWLGSVRLPLPEPLDQGGLILVCDVGGGTTDFTMVRARVEDGVPMLERVAVGEHLLLGGDNLDIALAALLESALSDRRLATTERLALRRAASAAKERLLSDEGLDQVPVTVLGAGRSMVGGTRSIPLTRAEVIQVLLDGFLPMVSVGDRPSRDRRTGLQELGLPYVSDPAITRHLVAFLAGAAGDHSFPRPDAVLFNGGFFTPPLARQRLVEVIARLFAPSGNWQPLVLENAAPSAAVALGAARYALVQRGVGVRVRAGSPRTYYLGLGRQQGDREAVDALCLVPRGTDEGTQLALDAPELLVATNRPVSFPLFSSTARSGEAGVVERIDAADLHRHAPLASVLRYGRKSRHLEIPVRLSAEYTETGTLHVALESRVSEHRWRLQFQLRGAIPEEEWSDTRDANEDEEVEATEPALTTAVIPPDRVEEARAAIAGTFGDDIPPLPSPESLPARLEAILGFGKSAWPVAAIRALADTLIPLAAGRRRSAAHEARWLNLLGFCLRPGFGAPLDEWRIGQVRGLYAEGLAHPADVQCHVEWIVLWQRVAGGLKAGQQRELAQRYASLLEIRGGKKGGRVNLQVQREAWRLLASLEHLPARDRAAYGDALLRRLAREPDNAAFLWSLGRLGARRPAYGPVTTVVAVERVMPWVSALLSRRRLTPDVAECLTQIGGFCDDPLRDLPFEVRDDIGTRLTEAGLAPEAAALHRLQPATRGDSSRVFGETLPPGLRVADGPVSDILGGP